MGKVDDTDKMLDELVGLDAELGHERGLVLRQWEFGRWGGGPIGPPDAPTETSKLNSRHAEGRLRKRIRGWLVRKNSVRQRFESEQEDDTLDRESGFGREAPRALPEDGRVEEVER
jgi:hypothetical protein